MNAMEIELNGAERTASIEVNAASAANDLDKEIVMSGEEDEDTSEVHSLLLDFNDEEVVEAAGKRLREKH